MATKRKNPFMDEVPRQRKVYIGPKQAAGVEEIKRVHDYTKYLLFKGSNPQASSEVLHSVGCVNGFTNGRIHPQNSKENISPRCFQCKQQSLKAVTCADCDRVVCKECHRVCSACGYSYCHYCSVLNYDLPEVRTICLNCLPTLQSS